MVQSRVLGPATAAFAVLSLAIGFPEPASGQSTLTWSGSGDGFTFDDPANWTPAPTAIDQEALVDNFVVDDGFAFVLIDVATVAGLNLTPAVGGTLSLEFLNGIVDTQDSTDPLAIEPFGGFAGDGDPTTTETMLVDGAQVFGHFVSNGLAVTLNSGDLTLRGVGNPINNATIEFPSTGTGRLLSVETPEDFVDEHLSKLTVDGLPAFVGVNLSVGSDGGVGTLVEVAPDPIIPGDLNGDDAITVADWQVFRGNLFTTFTPTTPRDDIQMGDLDLDGDVDELDFGAFKNVFETVNGPGSFARLTSAPEPASLALVMLVGCAAAARRRRLALLGVLIAFGVGGFTTTAEAVVIVEENFDYADGLVEGLDGGTGFAGAWGPVVGDTAPPTGAFSVAGNQAIYNGNGGGQITITQERPLAEPISIGLGQLVTIDLDVIIGPSDSQPGRGIGVNFIDNGDIAFTIGKRINNPIGLFGNGLGTGDNPLLAQVELNGGGSVGVNSITAEFTSDGTDTSVVISDVDTTATYTFIGETFTIDAIQLTGYHQSTTGNGIDDISIDVQQLANALLTLELDAAGNGTLVNNTGEDIALDLYKISSPGSNLNTAYAGIEGGPAQAGFPAGTGVGDGWEKAGGNSANEMGEAYLTGESMLPDGGSVALGQVLNTVDTGEALTLSYRDPATGNVLPGFISFATAPIDGDFNGDGVVDTADYTVWRDNLNGPSDSVINDAGDGVDGVTVADYAVWKSNFGNPPAPAAAPEPGAMLTAASGVLALGLARRRLVRGSR
ncbi:MAG: PEP-CTERM sorting domain-containing protein [Planctomycetota bacterium]